MGHCDREALASKNMHPYLAFKNHSSGINNDTELVLMEAVRQAHPNTDITPIAAEDVDILGWAKAGNAQLTALIQDHLFLRRRKYRSPENTGDGSDALYDQDIFGHYKLVYNGHTIDLYVVTFATSPILYKKTRLYYIVAPKAQASFVEDMTLSIARWTRRLHQEVYVFDNGEWQKNQELWRTIRASSWNDVILDPTIKQNLLQDVRGFFGSKAIYEKYNVPWKRGLILYGSPGNGKTLAIRSLLHALSEPDDISFLVVKTFRSCNEPEASIEEVFLHARDMAPCVLVFEDLDSMVTDSLRSYFLNQIDGMESNDGVLIIASTNHIDRLDSSISRRPSRFDKKYHFELPDRASRIRYCEYWAEKLRENDDILLTREIAELVAGLTEGFSFAYLKELLIQSLFAMVRGEADNVGSGEEIRKMVNASVPGVEVSDNLLSNALARVVCQQAMVLREDMKAQDV